MVPQKPQGCLPLTALLLILLSACGEDTVPIMDQGLPRRDLALDLSRYDSPPDPDGAVPLDQGRDSPPADVPGLDSVNDSPPDDLNNEVPGLDSGNDSPSDLSYEEDGPEREDRTRGDCGAPDRALADGAEDVPPSLTCGLAPYPPTSGCAHPSPGAIGWVGHLYPDQDTPVVLSPSHPSVTIYAQVWAEGVTDGPGPGESIMAQVMIDREGLLTQGCRSFPMAYNVDVGNNDEYMVTLTLDDVGPGVHRYSAAFSLDGAATWHWTHEPGQGGLLLHQPFEVIDEALLWHPPSLDQEAVNERAAAIRGLDAILMSPALTSTGGAYDVTSPRGDIELFLERRLGHLLQGLSSLGGTSLWQLYNDGYLLVTPQGVVGFDVSLPSLDDPFAWGWNVDQSLAERLADGIDLLLITHDHADHFDRPLAERVLSHGGHVVGPRGLGLTGPSFTPLAEPAQLAISGFAVEAFPGPHVYDPLGEIDLFYYRLQTPSGLRVIHTGDLDYTIEPAQSLPTDVLIIKAGGISPDYDDQNPLDRGDDLEAFLIGAERFPATLVIPGHLVEMGHPLGGGRESMAMALAFAPQMASCYRVMAWGEGITLLE